MREPADRGVGSGPGFPPERILFAQAISLLYQRLSPKRSQRYGLNTISRLSTRSASPCPSGNHSAETCGARSQIHK